MAIPCWIEPTDHLCGHSMWKRGFTRMWGGTQLGTRNLFVQCIVARGGSEGRPGPGCRSGISFQKIQQKRGLELGFFNTKSGMNQYLRRINCFWGHQKLPLLVTHTMWIMRMGVVTHIVCIFWLHLTRYHMHTLQLYGKTGACSLPAETLKLVFFDQVIEQL